MSTEKCGTLPQFTRELGAIRRHLFGNGNKFLSVQELAHVFCRIMDRPNKLEEEDIAIISK